MGVCMWLCVCWGGGGVDAGQHPGCCCICSERNTHEEGGQSPDDKTCHAPPASALHRPLVSVGVRARARGRAAFGKVRAQPRPGAHLHLPPHSWVRNMLRSTLLPLRLPSPSRLATHPTDPARGRHPCLEGATVMPRPWLWRGATPRTPSRLGFLVFLHEPLSDEAAPPLSMRPPCPSLLFACNLHPYPQH